jgi:hypothetical protein
MVVGDPAPLARGRADWPPRRVWIYPSDPNDWSSRPLPVSGGSSSSLDPALRPDTARGANQPNNSSKRVAIAVQTIPPEPMRGLVQSLRHTLPILLKSPGFTITAIPILRFGTGRPSRARSQIENPNPILRSLLREKLY